MTQSLNPNDNREVQSVEANCESVERVDIAREGDDVPDGSIPTAAQRVRFGGASEWIVKAGLALVILAGLTLRIWNVNFDRGTGSHPDERSTACFYATTLALPRSWDEFMDPQRSPLNPLWDLTAQRERKFTYGHFPLYLGTGFGELMHIAAPAAAAVGLPESATNLMARANAACDAIAVAGRIVIALLDTLTIFLLFLLGRRMFGSAIGLLAAALYAFTAQAIQLSHFFAMDPASTTFTVLAVLGGVVHMQDRTLRSALLSGLGAGLAISSKFSALPILAVPVVAAILAARSEVEERALAGEAGSSKQLFNTLVGAPLALVVAVVAFSVTSPYAILDRGTFLQATLVEQGQMVRGIADFPFTRQYRNTLPYLYFIQQQVQWGMGWVLGVSALLASVYWFAGIFPTLIGLLSPRARGGENALARRVGYANLIVWAWIIPYFGLTGAFLAKFNRYMSPLLPFAVLFVAGLVWELSRVGRRGGEPNNRAARSWAKAAALGLAVVSLGGAVFWSLAYVNGVYGREHTWLTASRMIYEIAPRGSTILWEVWDDPLPKAIPGEPGMDMGTRELRNIDWSPYEEDTYDKYLILREKLREADFVAYSSKRIYESVDELPERYPMTTLYYEAMWDGRLGFEMVMDVTSPPRLFGIEFEDRSADESWSLYDHPQVTIFRKVRDLSDAEFDALFAGTWERAIPHYVGEPSPLAPLLNLLGLGSAPESRNRGLINSVIRLLTGEQAPESVTARPSLMLDEPLDALPVVDNYRWNRWASEDALAGVVMWWLVVGLLGWATWPLWFWLFEPLRDRGYMQSRALGWLVAGWLVWLLSSVGLALFSVRTAWLVVALVVVAGLGAAYRQRDEIAGFVRARWPLLVVSEVIFGAAYAAFVLVRMANPDLWQPWFGGEKFMEFAFLNGILRSPTFPPVDPHFAGGFINYYYYGIYLVAFLIKLTGIYAEVAFNLAIPTLFGLTVSTAFSVAYNAFGGQRISWRSGLAWATAAPIFVAVMGNLDGLGQIMRRLSERSPVEYQSVLPPVHALVTTLTALPGLITGRTPLPAYDFWEPSRVIPNTINEFPYWSFLFADLHPHMIGIPFAVVCLGIGYAYLTRREIPSATAEDTTGETDSLSEAEETSRFDALRNLPLRSLALLAAFGFMVGTLAVINLWETPTYLGLGLLIVAVDAFRRRKPLALRLLIGGLVIGASAFMAYLPFFRNYHNVGASGVGWVREPDELGQWLLIWGFLAFVICSWVAARLAWREDETDHDGDRAKLSGVGRFTRLAAARWDRLPRMLALHGRIVRRPTVAYISVLALTVLGLASAAAGVAVGRLIFALCCLFLALSWLTLWRRNDRAEAQAAFVDVLATTGLAILAGTQIVYLKDFLQGGDFYRMNTLFKFFSQVWVIWGVAAGVAVPMLWQRISAARRPAAEPEPDAVEPAAVVEDRAIPGAVVADLPEGDNLPSRKLQASRKVRDIRVSDGWRVAWKATAIVLFVSSMVYLVLGTPARLSQRMVGWRPEIGTLNGMEYMRNGSYTWPNDANRFELRHDWEAIRWLLEHVRGNLVIVESSEVDYYRAGGTRVASFTGLSGLRGFHEGEQRYGDAVGERDGLHKEFWNTQDINRTLELMDRFGIDLIYVGQLERFLHLDGVMKLEVMAEQGMLEELYRNEGVVIYAVPGRLAAGGDGVYLPAAAVANEIAQR